MSETEALLIRPEEADDQGAVTTLLCRSFSGEVPVRLAHRLRTDGLAVPALTAVACLGRQVVGSLTISRVPVHGNGTWFEALDLTPFVVAPGYQGRGIGRRLMSWVIEAAERTEYPLIVLEGDPNHYCRYGFGPSQRHGIDRPSERIPIEAFQVRLLPAWRTGGHRGVAHYLTAFHVLGAIGP